MRNSLDFSSWQSLLTTLVGIALFSLVVVGIRLLFMHTVQLRRERENRQINERLRTLIAAYKVLGGSFTGSLSVDPTHLRDVHSRRGMAVGGGDIDASAVDDDAPRPGAERRRRIRDAVEAALSDVILLGTEEQVGLAARAAQDLAEGRPVETAALVVSLRQFIREVLDLDPVPSDVVVPRQGPARPGEGGRAGRDGRERAERPVGQGRGGAEVGAGAGAGGGGVGGMALGLRHGHDADAGDAPHA